MAELRISVPESALVPIEKWGTLAECLLYRIVRNSTGELSMMQLLESTKTHKKGRSAGGAIFSIILHSLIVFLAVFATARARKRKPEKVKAEHVRFLAW